MRIVGAVILIFTLGLLATQPLSGEVMIYIDESQHYVHYFDTITVAVNISGLNTTPLRGYKVNFAFDGYYLDVVGSGAFTEGDFLRDIGRTQFYTLLESDGSYTVTSSILSVTNGAYGGGTLFYVTLRAKDHAIGTVGVPGSGTDLLLSDVILRDPLNHNITCDTLSPGDVVISALPLYKQIKVFLQGPYLTGTGGTMTHHLSDSNYIPLTSPHDPSLTLIALPSIAPNYIVDWVQIELRSTATGVFEQPQSCFLLNNGAVVSVDGNPVLEFEYTSGYSYFVVVRHRNHLAVMSAAALTFSADPMNTTQADLTQLNSLYGGNQYGVSIVETGVLALCAGDADQDKGVLPQDMNDYWRIQTGLFGYRSADFDLDGWVLPNDMNDYWRLNTGKLSQVPNVL